MVWSKMALIFGAGTSELTKLQNVELTEEVARNKILTTEYLSGGEIITCTFAEGELKYVI
jgi:hypothetical protein